MKPVHSVWSILAVLGTFMLSGVLHELGHVIAVLALGGQIREFQPFIFLGSPHVSYVAHLTPAGVSIVHISGMLLSLSTGIVLLVVIPWRRLSLAAGFIWSSATLPFLAQIIAWVSLPLIYILGGTANDDSIKFLLSSGLPAPFLAVAALIAATLIGRLFFVRTGYAYIIRELHKN